MPTLRALVFDFDGLILDTESPAFNAWQEFYAAHGGTLVAADWATVIGSTHHGWDPAADLMRQTGKEIDADELHENWRARKNELTSKETLRPGVLELLKDAKHRGLGIGIASSSPKWWVQGHVERLGIIDYFGAIATGDEVELSKPDPAVYLLALKRLGLDDATPGSLLALEDSPNGIRAARGAGLRCIAVPNPVTAHLDLSAADAVLPSLADVDLDALPYA